VNRECSIDCREWLFSRLGNVESAMSRRRGASDV